jgi:hypothetical protein
MLVNKNLAKSEAYGYDPLLVVINLVLLKFHAVGTKLSFYANQIYIQPPSYVQAAARKYYGNSKNELADLFVPIYFCINKYLVQTNNIYVRDILKNSIDGLNLLQITYKSDILIVLVIQSIIDMITDGLNGTFKDYKNLKIIMDEFETKSINDDLWNDLSITVLNQHISSCNAEFGKLSMGGAADVFNNQLSKLEGFVKAKEKRYSEFLDR